jgi:hypothetical protein
MAYATARLAAEPLLAVGDDFPERISSSTGWSATGRRSGKRSPQVMT